MIPKAINRLALFFIIPFFTVADLVICIVCNSFRYLLIHTLTELHVQNVARAMEQSDGKTHKQQISIKTKSFFKIALSLLGDIILSPVMMCVALVDACISIVCCIINAIVNYHKAFVTGNIINTGEFRADWKNHILSLDIPILTNITLCCCNAISIFTEYLHNMLNLDKEHFHIHQVKDGQVIDVLTSQNDHLLDRSNRFYVNIPSIEQIYNKTAKPSITFLV